MPWPSLGGLEAWITASRLGIAAGIAAIWLAAVTLLHVNDRFFNRVDARLTRYNVPERKLNKLDTLADALIVAVAGLLSLYMLGIGEALWGAIALTSILGVVVGLAAQRFGENLIAGVVILFERPFQVGDAIEIDGLAGTVEAVTLHSTMLKSPEGPKVTMPNQQVLDGAVTNFSAHRERRISVSIDVDVQPERVDDVTYAIRQAVQADEHAIEEREPTVFVSESLDEGLRLTVRYWVDAEHYGDHCRPTSLRRVLDALEHEGFATAMAAQRVHVEN